MKTELTKSELKINKIEMIGKIIDYICLSLIGILCVGFLIFYSDFAKLHIDLAVLHVPLFIGYFVFIICSFIFLFKWVVERDKLNMVFCVFMFYVSFIFIKALWGYFYWGPLALRHTVLFSYPLFAVFFYSFYRRSFFTGKKNLLIIFFAFCVFLFMKFHPYYASGCFLLVFLLINKQPKLWPRLVLFVLLLAVFPYKLIFSSQRTFIVSNILLLLYVNFCLLFLLRVKARYKILLCSLFLSFTIYGLAKYSNYNELRSIVAFEKLRSGYNEIINNYSEKEAAFTPKALKIKMYNEGNFKLAYSNFMFDQNTHRYITNLNSNFTRQKSSEFNTVQVKSDKAEIESSNLPAKSVTKVPVSFRPVVNMTDRVIKTPFSNSVEGKSSELNIVQVKSDKAEIESSNFPAKSVTKVPVSFRPVVNMIDRGIETPYSNSLFRIAIWSDALRELRSELPIFGFDFGRPFRSRILEVSQWAETVWKVNGWVCLHNSYLDIIYRSGIVGILIVIVIFTAIFSLAKISLTRRSLTGVLLTGVLLNWITAAFFMEIFEMPYSAIPLWSLFGLTFAYLFKDKA